MILFVLCKLNSSNAHVQPFRGTRSLIFSRTLRLLSYFMCANSEGSGETAQMHRLAWAYAGRPCDIEDIRVFQCKIEFYFTEWTPQAVFSRVAVARSENADCGFHEWNKIQSYTEKIRFPVSFTLLFAIIMFLPTRQLSRQKTYFFPSHFASISSCSAYLVGIIWGENTVLYLENEPKYHFDN